jgi:hypothetical protein
MHSHHDNQYSYPRDTEDGEFSALDEANIAGARLILCMAVVLYTAVVFAIGWLVGSFR